MGSNAGRKGHYTQFYRMRTIENLSRSSMLVCAKRQVFHHHWRFIMNQSKSTGTQNKQSDNNLSEEELAKQRAGKQDKSSHDAKSRVRAGTGEGAGGGAKQKQGH
jgi:hypothetical protein